MYVHFTMKPCNMCISRNNLKFFTKKNYKKEINTTISLTSEDPLFLIPEKVPNTQCTIIRTRYEFVVRRAEAKYNNILVILMCFQYKSEGFIIIKSLLFHLNINILQK